ncbi:UBA/THIF-type NAD/FAD binding protein [Paenibacillus curdlanolyticus YK9]|uniref:UBA/THIF-type NAD/FAD binding protein n=1 Tax=Paenibacillus curdlanolyticus YK9 TaxID=717606 RepID=E0IBV9_9BACL|nr:ThiF family adenylyltransferase [Paenibacillus curdlanolyticus]EFM10189.1 UBA/THIF-type NAD/FAD binding protein [Paenibacillus curdlanolyticus YK9]
MTENPSSEPHSPSMRYARQIRFAPIGSQGQQAISARSAVIVGMGALGSIIAQHLVRAGIGRLRIIDRDIVEWSNLQRQVLYMEEDAAQMLPKAEAAAIRLHAANSLPVIEPIVTDLVPHHAEELLTSTDLIIDGTDNFSTRYLLNEISVKYDIPWIYGGAVGGSGMTMTILPGETPCFRCLFPSPPAGGTTDTCETAGVISPIIDIIGSLQAAEALKWLSGNRQAMNPALLQADVWNNRWLQVRMDQSRRADCPVCARREYEWIGDHNVHAPAAAALCGRNTIQITPDKPMQISLETLANRLAPAGHITVNRFLLRIQLAQSELSLVVFPDGRALVQGTDQAHEAKRLYTQLLGQ